jgi:hypothetical protein
VTRSSSCGPNKQHHKNLVLPQEILSHWLLIKKLGYKQSVVAGRAHSKLSFRVYKNVFLKP